MLTRIIRHDLRTPSADRTVSWMIALFGLIVGFGLYNGAARVNAWNETLAEAVRDQDDRLAEIREQAARVDSGDLIPGPYNNPQSPSYVGGVRGQRFAMAPPGPLAAMAIGQNDLYPHYYKINNRSSQSFLDNEEIENPASLLSGRFDLGFVIIYLFPLLILALSHDLISAEREQGTLAMVLSQPVRAGTLVIGKALARLGLVAALVVGLSIAGALAAVANPARGDVAVRLSLWVGVVIAYAAFWFALAVAVNALGRSSATNAVILVGAWMVLVIVAPALLNIAITALHPVPSRVELIQTSRDASTTASREGSNLLARFYEDHPTLAPTEIDLNPTDFWITLQAAQDSVDEAIAPILARYDAQLGQQQRLVDRLGFLSPAIVAQEALNDLAGAGMARRWLFLEQVNEFHERWRAFFVPRIMRREMLSSGDYDNLPAFAFREEDVGDVARRVGLSLLGIALPTALVALVGLWGFRRVRIAG